MRNASTTIGLAALALGVGIASASAATIDPNDQAKSATARSSLAPAESLGHFGGGLSAVRSHRGSKGLTEGSLLDLPATGYASPAGLSRPDEGHPWRDGVAALAAPFPGATALKSSDAVKAPAGMRARKTGLAAIKGRPGPRPAGFLDLPSDGYIKRNDGVARPAGTDWSDRGRESLRADSVGPVPGNLLGK